MFLDKNKPTINELVYWFQVNFTKLADDMKASNHNAAGNEPNPYHIEDGIWAHTMMVCLRAELDDCNKINNICALLHDIGKPASREEIPFEAKKPVHSESNEIRNDGKNDGKPSGLQRVMPASGIKTHFRGHEGLSFYKAIAVVNKLEAEGILTLPEKIQVLSIVSMHGTLFDNIDADGEMKKETKVFDKFNNVELFNNFVQQVKNDSLGRFFTSKDGRKNNASRLGKDIFTEDQYIAYYANEASKVIVNNPITKNSPWIKVLVGVPGSGKSTWMEDNLDGATLISRDETVIEFGKDFIFVGEGFQQRPMTYSEIWKRLTDKEQKEVDAMVQVNFKAAVKSGENIVIDMTNVSRKARRKWLTNVSKEYKKEAVVFATGYYEVWKRLQKREEETGKAIPSFAVMNMMKGFIVPDDSEVDKTTWIF